MCGIIGYAGDNQTAPILLNGLRSLEYRGYDSAGIAVIDKNKLNILKTEGKIENLQKKLDGYGEFEGRVGIGHTRWATHGEPNETNSHPHADNSGMFAVVHNGIIENYDVIKDALQKKGIVFKSQTDTEVIPQLLSYFYEGNLLEAVQKTLNVLSGSYALGIICKDYPEKIIAARKASPLIIAKGDGENFLSSDISAVLSYTNEYFSLEDDVIAEIYSDNVLLYDKELNKVEAVFTKTNLDAESVQKNGFEHFMLKEIHEQPDKLRNLFDERIVDGKIQINEFENLKEILKDCKKIYAVACGSAYHAAVAGKYVLEKLCLVNVETDIASEFRYRDPILDKKTPVIVISQSGETADTIAAMRLAKKKGANVIGIVNVYGSTVANECDCVLYMKAGPEIAVATTKGYTTQLAWFYMIALYMASLRKTVSEEEMKLYCNELKSFPEKISSQIGDTEIIKKYSKKFSQSQNMYFIGRNTDYAAAMEASLKVKEISYINSEAYPSGELKHGTIALIDKGTPVISFCSNKELFDKSMSNAEEVKARGADVVCVVSENHADRLKDNYGMIKVPETLDVFTSLPEVVAMQIFSYYIAKEKGCDIDMPKNLAKSVTVE